MTVPNQIFTSADQGASAIGNTTGSRITTIFDPVLVNGYNSLSVTSMTRSGSTVTVTTASAHGYPTAGPTAGLGPYVYIKIAGATQTDYNGVWKATPTGASTLTFDIGAATPTTPATGTITCARAPVGWTKAFTGTNKAAYLSPDGKCYLRVVDTGTNSCLCQIYRTMSDVDTGTDVAPATATLANGVFWNIAASAQQWWVQASGNHVNMIMNYTGTNFGQLLSFGKLAKLRVSGDDWAYHVLSGQAASAQAGQIQPRDWTGTGNNSGWLMRAWNAAAGSITALFLSPIGVPAITTSGLNTAGNGACPQPADGSILLDEFAIADVTIKQVRGIIPGIRYINGGFSGVGAQGDCFDGGLNDSGRAWMILRHFNGGAVAVEISDTVDV